MSIPKITPPFLLSSLGSDRASAYTMGNKIVTLGDRTHVTWTDAIALTRGRTFDHSTRAWGPTLAIGEGCDNHNNPCLVADKRGHLRIAYGPHGRYGNYPDGFPNACYKYAIAPAPNTFEGLDKSHVAAGEAFGYHASYASMTHAPQGLDCIVYRGGEHPPSLFFQRQQERGGWTKAIELADQLVPPGYTHYGPMITCDALGTLYVAFHFYARVRGYSQGCAVLRSTDLGKTWTDLYCQRADLPILANPRFAPPHSDPIHDPRIAGIACDSRHRLWVMTASYGVTDSRVLLSCFDDNRWNTTDLSQFLPREKLATLGTFTIDHKDRIHAVIDAGHASLAATGGGGKWWGDASLEVFHLFSADGKNYTCTQVSDGDAANANWLSNLTKPGPFHPVTRPVILWTKGKTNVNPAEGCMTTTHTEVYCSFVEVD